MRDCAGFEDQRAFNEDQLGLHAVAKATEGFSGADLRALATDAHMHAVHRAMESETPGDDEGEVVDAVVTREDVARAAREARRSVPVRERERLDAVFAEFRGSRVGSGGEATPGKSPKRVSLA